MRFQYSVSSRSLTRGVRLIGRRPVLEAERVISLPNQQHRGYCRGYCCIIGVWFSSFKFNYLPGRIH